MNTRTPEPAMEELGRVPIFGDTELNEALAKARTKRGRGGQSQ